MSNQPTNKRDNWSLATKVELRLRHLPDVDPVRVLDVFGGRGLIWRSVQGATKKRIQRTGLDLRDTGGAGQLRGDNRKYLPMMDLSCFDVIDLDAYGSPFPQMEAIFHNATKREGTVVYYTFMRCGMGQLNHTMLKQLGYTMEMVRKVPTIFGRNAHEKWLAWLSTRGIKQVSYIKRDNQKQAVGTVDRFYGIFVI